jgi:hypothetical protein
VLEQAWLDSSNGPTSLQATWDTLNGVATSLGQWSRDTFGSVQQKIRNLEKHLKYLRLAPWRDTDDEASTVERELCELFERE